MRECETDGCPPRPEQLGPGAADSLRRLTFSQPFTRLDRASLLILGLSCTCGYRLIDAADDLRAALACRLAVAVGSEARPSATNSSAIALAANLRSIVMVILRPLWSNGHGRPLRSGESRHYGAASFRVAMAVARAVTGVAKGLAVS
jgi:hypothetical protein